MSVSKLAKYKEEAAAVCGVLSLAVANGLLHGTAEVVVNLILSVATVTGVYQAKRR